MNKSNQKGRLLRFLCTAINLSLILFLTLATSCAKDIIDTTGNITGTVRDARTNEPIQGASVSVVETGATVSTGADGSFNFRDLLTQNYTLKASKNNYKPDSKSVFVAAGKDNRADITLSPSVAVLELSQTTLDFGPTTTSLTFDIKNTGSSQLSWSISEDIPWLNCTPTSGKTEAGEKSSVVVNVKRDGLERGNYSQTIAITSSGGSEVVRVDMEVLGSALSINPEVLDFGTATTSLQLTLTNTGIGSINYRLSTSNDWIKLSKTSGVVSTKDNVNVSVDRGDFSPGEYQGYVTVTADSQDILVPVTMRIASKEQPTVTLYDVQDVTYNSAQFKGGIVSVGSARVTKHGFCWSKVPEPTLENSATSNFGDCTEARDFSYSATGLDANTVYYVRAYAQNAEGLTYSNTVKFQTLGTPEKPGVETGSVSSITDNQAIVAGNIINLGNVLSINQYGHVWSETSSPTVQNHKTELGSTAQTGSYISTLTGLKPNTTYYVRAYAVNSVGTTYGEEVTFTTLYGAVDITTDYAQNITYKSAAIPCRILSRGGHTVTEVGACWSLSSTPQLTDNVVKAQNISDSYVVALDGLTDDTKYYVRAYAKTAEGATFFGNEIMFMTNPKDIVIDKDDYTGDSDWDSKGNATIGKGGYGDDQNWDGKGNATIDKGSYGDDQNWDNPK